MVSVWCELVWVKVVNCGPSYLCRRALFLWPSTRLRSVCLSRSCILSKRVPGNRIFIFSLSGSHVILVFPYQVPDSFRQPNQFCLDSPSHSLVNPSLLSSPLSSSITLSLQAQNLPFQQILPTLTLLLYSLACHHDNGNGADLSYSSVYFQFSFIFFVRSVW